MAKITHPSLGKIRWLLESDGFRRRPVRTIGRAVGWEIVRLLGRPRTLSFDGDLQLMVEPNDGIGRLTYYFGYHEPDAFRFLDTFLEPGMTFVDVGANIGAYALFAARRVGPLGRVFAFEPDPANCAKLRCNISLNGIENIDVHETALSDRDAEVSLVRVADSSRSCVMHRRSPSTPQVAGARLDAVLGNADGVFPARVDFVKIDVEGFELFVLRGARALLEKRPPSVIQLEMSQHATEIAALLHPYGYRMHALQMRDDEPHFEPVHGAMPFDAYALHSSFSGFGRTTG